MRSGGLASGSHALPCASRQRSAGWCSPVVPRWTLSPREVKSLTGITCLTCDGPRTDPLILTVTLTVTQSINHCFSKFCFLQTELMLRQVSKCLASKAGGVLQPLLHGEVKYRETEHGAERTVTAMIVHRWHDSRCRALCKRCLVTCVLLTETPGGSAGEAPKREGAHDHERG